MQIVTVYPPPEEMQILGGGAIPILTGRSWAFGPADDKKLDGAEKKELKRALEDESSASEQGNSTSVHLLLHNTRSC